MLFLLANHFFYQANNFNAELYFMPRGMNIVKPVLQQLVFYQSFITGNN